MCYEKMPYGETLIRTQIKTLILTLIFSEHGTHVINEKNIKVSINVPINVIINVL